MECTRYDKLRLRKARPDLPNTTPPIQPYAVPSPDEYTDAPEFFLYVFQRRSTGKDLVFLFGTVYEYSDVCTYIFPVLKGVRVSIVTFIEVPRAMHSCLCEFTLRLLFIICIYNKRMNMTCGRENTCSPELYCYHYPLCK